VKSSFFGWGLCDVWVLHKCVDLYYANIFCWFWFGDQNTCRDKYNTILHVVSIDFTVFIVHSARDESDVGLCTVLSASPFLLTSFCGNLHDFYDLVAVRCWVRYKGQGNHFITTVQKSITTVSLLINFWATVLSEDWYLLQKKKKKKKKKKVHDDEHIVIKANLGGFKRILYKGLTVLLVLVSFGFAFGAASSDKKSASPRN
jgi:hypothetical protein